MITHRPPTPDVLARFSEIVGAKNALTDPVEQSRYLVENRGIYFGHTPLVLRPDSTAQVAAILKLANETRTAIVPQGGNTGLVGGQISEHGEVLLSLERLNQIREVDAASGTMTCEAGVVLAKAQAAAEAASRLFPLSLGAEGSCTIGGNLATNAGGTAAVVYGTARDLVLGLEVALADGRVWNGLNKLKKDNTGYDLRNIFIGSEGTLGVITAAVLKLFPRPRSKATAFVAVPSPRAALALFNIAQDFAGGGVTTFELIPRIGIEFAVTHGNCRDPMAEPSPWYALMELSSHRQDDLHDLMENVLSAGLEQNLVTDAVIAASLDQTASFWRTREMLAETQSAEGGSIKHDVSVPISAIPAFIERANAAVERLIPGCRPVAFGHLGDGNVHYNVSQPLGMDKQKFLALWDEVNTLVHGVVADYRGSISAEHGIGVLKRDLLPGAKDPVALELMKTFKHALDPNGIMNPGKVLQEA